MNAVHFSEVVNNHDLIIPFELLKLMNHQEVEIVVFPKKGAEKNKDPAKNIQSIFKKYKGVNPFADITDAVMWQKGLRNEW